MNQYVIIQILCTSCTYETRCYYTVKTSRLLATVGMKLYFMNVEQYEERRGMHFRRGSTDRINRKKWVQATGLAAILRIQKEHIHDVIYGCYLST